MPNLFSYRQFELIAQDIRAMSAAIRAARDIPPAKSLAQPDSAGGDEFPTGATGPAGSNQNRAFHPPTNSTANGHLVNHSTSASSLHSHQGMGSPYCRPAF